MTYKYMKKLYHTISEAAEMLGENISTVRYWSNTFEKYLRPKRNGKGNRMFVEKELETLKTIKHLTRDCGLSLEAVARKLDGYGKGEDKILEIRDSLLKIRERLVQIRQTL